MSNTSTEQNQMNRIEAGAVRSTPWGKSDYVVRYATGINFYGTPSHGGFFVSPSKQQKMPEALRNFRSPYSPEGWFEEDCDWAIVALAFPEIFTGKEVVLAVRSVNAISSDYASSVKAWLNSPEAHSIRAIVEAEEARENRN